MSSRVSVLTPVLNESAHIRAAVERMSAQTWEGELELIFIDGGSSDDTVKILCGLQRLDPRIEILHNPQRFTPHGLNVGLAHASGEYVARMDAHTLYPDDYLANGVRRLQDEDVAWVSGPQLPLGRGRWSSLTATALDSRLGIGGAAFRRAGGEEIEVDSGFTGVWRRSTLDHHGGWDEGWRINQDGELAARIRAEGGRIVCLPEMAAAYIPRDSLQSLSKQYRHYGFYRVKTCRRHPASMRRSHLLAPGLALILLASLAPDRRLRRAAGTGFGVYAAVVAVTGMRLTRGRRSGAPALCAVFATMHLSWGFGFLAGCLRFGLPLRALAALAGIKATRLPEKTSLLAPTSKRSRSESRSTPGP